MAKKQTRRALSLSRAVYDAVMIAAAERSVSAAQLLEDALCAYLPDIPPTTLAAIAQRQRRESPAARAERQERIAAARAAADAIAEEKRAQMRAGAEEQRAELLKRSAEARAERDVVRPCRRERCPFVFVHEDGSCL